MIQSANGLHWRETHHATQVLIECFHDRFSKPREPFKVNDEQLRSVAVFVQARWRFLKKDLSSIRMVVIPAEGGICGKTTSIVDVSSHVLRAYLNSHGAPQ